MPGCSPKWAFTPRLHPPPVNVSSISVSSLTSRMPLRDFVIHSVGFLSSTLPSICVLFICKICFLPLCLPLRFEHSGVTCSFCLYPFPVSFVVVLLYKRISKRNILSGVTLYCTLDTGELRMYSVLWSFFAVVRRHITAKITVWRANFPGPASNVRQICFCVFWPN